MHACDCEDGSIERALAVLFVSDGFGRGADVVAAVLARGWRADVAVGAEAGLVALQSSAVDVLVTDAGGAGTFDGFALARRVKSDPHTLYVPVVVITDRTFEGSRSRLHVVRAPCAAEAVVTAIDQAAAIARLLARRRAVRDAGLDLPVFGARRSRAGLAKGARPS